MKKSTGKKYLMIVAGGTIGFAAFSLIKFTSVPIIIWSASSAVIGSAMTNYRKMVEADDLMREFAEWIASKTQRVEG